MEQQIENSQELEENRILVIDDDETFCKLMKAIAAKNNIELDYIVKANDLEKKELLEDYDAIWIDYDLMETTGLAIAEDLNEIHPDIPVVMISTTNRPFSDDMQQLPNVKAILSKWDLTDEEIGNDLIENTMGRFHSSSDIHTSQWQNNDEEQVEQLKDHFDYAVPVEKYRA